MCEVNDLAFNRAGMNHGNSFVFIGTRLVQVFEYIGIIRNVCIAKLSIFISVEHKEVYATKIT